MENINVGLRAKEEWFRRWCHFKRREKFSPLQVMYIADHVIINSDLVRSLPKVEMTQAMAVSR